MVTGEVYTESHYSACSKLTVNLQPGLISHASGISVKTPYIAVCLKCTVQSRHDGSEIPLISKVE